MRSINYNGYYWQNDLIRLRAVGENDWEEQYHNKFDSENRFLLDCELELPPIPSEEQKTWEKFMNFNTESGNLMLTIETLDGINVGGINLHSINERHGTFRLGIQINRDQRNKGYATSAMKMLLRYAFFERRLHKYDGGYVKGNIASEILHQKLGCKLEGIRREVLYHNGRYWDEELCGLTKQEFIEIEKLTDIKE